MNITFKPREMPDFNFPKDLPLFYKLKNVFAKIRYNNGLVSFTRNSLPKRIIDNFILRIRKILIPEEMWGAVEIVLELQKKLEKAKNFNGRNIKANDILVVGNLSNSKVYLKPNVRIEAKHTLRMDGFTLTNPSDATVNDNKFFGVDTAIKIGIKRKKK